MDDLRIDDVMYTVAETADVKLDQKVSLFRNGSIFTVMLTNTENHTDFNYVRVDLPQDTALKLYLKLVRAILTGKYSWEIRSGWVKKAGKEQEAARAL